MQDFCAAPDVMGVGGGGGLCMCMFWMVNKLMQESC